MVTTYTRSLFRRMRDTILNIYERQTTLFKFISRHFVAILTTTPSRPTSRNCSAAHLTSLIDHANGSVRGSWVPQSVFYVAVGNASVTCVKAGEISAGPCVAGAAWSRIKARRSTGPQAQGWVAVGLGTFHGDWDPLGQLFMGLGDWGLGRGDGMRGKR